ncbi:MAG TPA: UvrD-helicase domain-containing protein [Terrimicrobiaceae bacterium]
MSRFRIFDLNREQLQAVEHTDGPLLILAGAGTGKTRTITARIAWLIAQGEDPSSILAVTFTNKAAREMKERIAKMVDPSEVKRITASTFHALCLRILRTDAERLGYKANFSIFDEGDQLGLIKKLITRSASRDEKLDPQQAKNFISKAKNDAWRARDDDSLLATVCRRYEQELRSLNAMDFDDLLVQAVRLLSEFPEVREKWRIKARHLLVDEFQDTNRLQLELVTQLASGKRPNICVVGDDDQSIYGWRGAEVANILEFENHFPNPCIIRLEQNYRSTNAILSAANRLISNNPRRRAKKLWSPRQGGDPVRVISVPDERAESEFVAREVVELGAERRLSWEEIAVIFRMNAQSRLLEENFRRNRIPYRVIGGKSFFERREIKDVMAYMAVLLNSSDDSSLLRIINNPPRGIGPTNVELALAFSIERKLSLFEALRHPSFLEASTRKAAGAIQAFVDDIEAARIRVLTPGTDCAHLLSTMLEECGYLDDLKRSCKTPDESLNREENVKEMLRALKEYQSRTRHGLQGFLDEVSLDREREQDSEQAARGVTLITLHAAKGLEFPHVFLVGAEDGLLPHERSKAEGTVDEERRLFYVGITRAMRSLTVTWCRARRKFGSLVHCRPSPFLREIRGDGVCEETYEELMSRPLEREEVSLQFARLRAQLTKS